MVSSRWELVRARWRRFTASSVVVSKGYTFLLADWPFSQPITGGTGVTVGLGVAVALALTASPLYSRVSVSGSATPVDWQAVLGLEALDGADRAAGALAVDLAGIIAQVGQRACRLSTGAPVLPLDTLSPSTEGRMVTLTALPRLLVILVSYSVPWVAISA